MKVIQIILGVLWGLPLLVGVISLGFVSKAEMTDILGAMFVYSLVVMSPITIIVFSIYAAIKFFERRSKH